MIIVEIAAIENSEIALPCEAFVSIAPATLSIGRANRQRDPKRIFDLRPMSNPFLLSTESKAANTMTARLIDNIRIQGSNGVKKPKEYNSLMKTPIIIRKAMLKITEKKILSETLELPNLSNRTMAKPGTNVR